MAQMARQWMQAGLEGPGMKPLPSQEKYKNIFSSFWLVTLEPMRSNSKYLCLFGVFVHVNMWQYTTMAGLFSFEEDGKDQKMNDKQRK